MNTHDKYALPPLPEPLCNLPTYCQNAIKQYTRSVLDDYLNEQDAAIEGVEEEILICTLDGYQYFLGPEYDGNLDWADAKKWCESLGEGYELPSRLVMLAICMNEETAAFLTKNTYYWTSTVCKDDAPYAWSQHWRPGYPGNQSYASKPTALRVRAVRRRRIEGGWGMKTYGLRVTFYNKTYGVTGCSSELEAALDVYGRAYEDGVWTPPKLREKWWQVWRPAQHDEIEAHFAALDQGEPDEHTRH